MAKESTACVEALGSIRVNLSAEIETLRERIDEDTSPRDEMRMRAQLSGLELALSIVCQEVAEN
jgi:hypothetical protein